MFILLFDATTEANIMLSVKLVATFLVLNVLIPIK